MKSSLLYRYRRMFLARPSSSPHRDRKAAMSSHGLLVEPDGAPEAPESRAARIVELRQQVLSGTYQVPIAKLVRLVSVWVLRR